MKKKTNLLSLIILLTGCSNNISTSKFDPWDNLNGGGNISSVEVENIILDNYNPENIIEIKDEQLNTSEENATLINLDEYKEDKLVINESGVYVLSGNYNGEIEVGSCNDEEVRIILNSVNIQTKESSLNPAILFKKTSALRILTIKDNTINTLKDNVGNVGDDAEESIISSKKSSLTINGKGTLNLEAVGENSSGIKVKKELTIIDTSININADKNGIKADDKIITQGALISINALNDGVKTDKEPESEEEALEFASSMEEGYIYIKNSSIDIISGDDGIAANNAMYIDNLTDNHINIVTNNGAPSSITESSSDNADGKAIKVGGITYTDENDNETDYSATYENNYSLIIKGGTFNLNSNDDAISSKGNLFILGGIYDISSGDDAIHAEYLTSISEGTIKINKCYEGIEGASVEIRGGNINIKSVDDGINAANSDLTHYDYYIYISGGNICVDAEGDGVDSNGWIKMEGGNLTIYGPTKQDNGSLDSETGVLVTGGNLIAIGPTGMVETPVKNSTQCYISINLPSSQSADTPIKLYDEDENELLNITPQKKYQSVILSLYEFNLNDTYIVEIGSQTYEAKLTSIGTALGTNSMGGGNQGGRPVGPNKPW